MVEALVSMLVLGLLVTPLLLNFRVAFTTNMNASEASYAQSYGQQVLEALKSYGASSVDNQFRGKEDFDITDLAAGASEGVADSSFRIQSSPDEFVHGDVRHYSILGGTDGSRTYDVQITYDPTDYSQTELDEHGKLVGAGATSFDINSFPDASVFSSDTTVVIDPGSTYMVYDTRSGSYVYDTEKDRYSGSRSTSYEEIALNGYYSMYVSLYQRMCDVMNDIMTTERFNLPSDYYISASDIGIYSMSKMKAALAKNLTRRTGILIDGRDGNLNVTASLIFDVDLTALGDSFGSDAAIESAIREHVSGNLIRNDGEPMSQAMKEELGGKMWDAASAELSAFFTENAAGLDLEYSICQSTSMNDLERIYLMYDPLLRSKWSKNDDTICVYISDDGDTAGESILEKFRDRKLELYIVPQIGLAKMDSGVKELQSTNYVKPKLTFCKIESDEHQQMTLDLSDRWNGFANTIHINYMENYLNLSGSGVSAGSGGASSSIVAREESGIEVIYRVTVSVYEHADSTSQAFKSEPLVTLEGSFG